MRALVADVVDASCVDGPGNRFVVFFQGCTFNCTACHNPHTIAVDPATGATWRDTADLHTEIAAKAAFLSGVTVSGGEATLQWAAVRDLFRLLAGDPATAGLTRLVDSNGDADLHVWDELAASMDAAMIDLKALDPDVHQLLTGRSNARVLASIRRLAGIGRLAEVRLLIVPGVNDTPAQLEATAHWLAGLGTPPPTVVQGFRPTGARPAARRWRAAVADDLAGAAALLIEHGVPAERVTVRGLTGI